jgi:hypothetical protein
MSPNVSPNADRLYDLLPVVYRTRDAAQGYPLRALLQVISEQVNVVDADIAGLYENWFIETCQEWVVPYIGGLVGYTPVEDSAQLGNVTSSRGIARERVLIPRREVANTIRYRRRKGTLALLEELAMAVADWPSQAVEFYRLLGVEQNINYLHLERGRTVDVRNGRELELLGGPFDREGHTVDVRRPDSQHSQGRFNIPSVGLFVWRLQTFSVTQSPAYCYEEEAPNCYLFSILGNDSPLFTNAQAATAGQATGPLNFPTPITRRALEPIQAEREIAPAPGGLASYYGPGLSFQVWLGSLSQPVPQSQIVAADLSGWTYRPLPNQVAVDPRLGRIVLPPAQTRKQGVWVSYYYGFSAPIGGGEYERPMIQPAGSRLYLVGAKEAFTRINDALKQWTADAPVNAVVEITDSGAYVEQINITLRRGQTLEVRAASGSRPVIRLLDWQNSESDDLEVSGEPDSWFIMDGLLITGRGVQIGGHMEGVVIRHSTLVPGWGLNCDCGPKRPTEPSLVLMEAPQCVVIEHSIIGPIQVTRNESKLDPVVIRISDSIVDACSAQGVAVGDPEKMCAYSKLTILRSTVFGTIKTQTLELAENCIFIGTTLACRRQKGCVRFCYVTPGSRTPRRYECQPDMVLQAVNALKVSAQERTVLLAREQLRVTPEFNSTRYGTPTYCQLSLECATEIVTGASDESEMGVFHDLYQPQRMANLATRLTEYTPAGANAGIIYCS